MNISIPNWAKPLLTVAYSVSGWVIVEIPVLLNILPATFDGYSTAGVAAGLGFVLSGAYYIHTHIKPYIVSATPVPAPSSAPMGTATSSNGTDSTVLNSSKMAISISPTVLTSTEGSSITINGDGFSPGGRVNIADYTGAQIAIVKADANGKFITTATYSETATAISNLADAIQSAKENEKTSLVISAYDYTIDEYSNDVTVSFS